jgi:hypothetical protein
MGVLRNNPSGLHEGTNPIKIKALQTATVYADGDEFQTAEY